LLFWGVHPDGPYAEMSHLDALKIQTT
jgi:hypothetical protein